MLLCSNSSIGSHSYSESKSLLWPTRPPRSSIFPYYPPLSTSFLANLTYILALALGSLYRLFLLHGLPFPQVSPHPIHSPSQSLCPSVTFSLSLLVGPIPWSHNLKMQLTHPSPPYPALLQSFPLTSYHLFNKACYFLICHVYYLTSVFPARMWAHQGGLHLFCSLMCLRLPKQCRAQNWCSINVCWIGEWMKC